MSVPAISSNASSPTAVYFIDAGLRDLDTLLAGLPAGAEVVLLDPAQDGLAQMLAALDGRSGIDALHILTHGAPGQIQLGNAQLDASTLPAAGTSLQALGEHLSADADILFYGCDVAATDDGQALIGQIAELTGADVAASTDLTGASRLGGDWELEASSGTIEASVAIDSAGLQDYAATLAAHSGTVSGQVFLGGDYIELGISNVGSFGTTVSAPGGFYGTASTTQVGMSNDADGYGTGKDLRIDYFLPGSPEERWAVGYNGSSYGGFSAKNGNSGNATTLSGTSVTNNTSGNTLSATFDTTVQNTLDVTQVHTFQVSDKYFKTTVTIKNVSGSPLTDVRYMRSFDPDNTVFKGGDYTTINKVENTFGDDGKSVVSATSKADSYSAEAGSTAKILFFSSDPRAYASNFGFSNSNPYSAPVQAKGYTTTSDSAIAITFKLGTLAAGASATFDYYTSLDTADVSTTIAKIEAASNPAPTFTEFAAPIDTTNEDFQVELTFAELAAQGNEADQMPDPDNVGSLKAGTVTAFVVTNIKTGNLKIGADAGSATAWNPGTNDVIDATHKAYWTPAVNANNTENGNTAINAFDVKARDTDGLLSSTAVTAKVNVTAVNDAPVIASAGTNISLIGVNEDQASITGAAVSALVGPRFTDVDAGASMGGIIIVGDTSTAEEGSWKYSTNGTDWFAVGTVSAASGLALPSTAKLAFFPKADWHGTPGGLTVHVTDNLYAGDYTSGDTRDMETTLAASGVSASTVNIVTTVNSINDLPTITSAQGAASLTETNAWDTSATTASGALIGTLTGDDVEDGTSVSFTIRGGTTEDSSVSKAGFYGSLTLDTATNEWTYTPDNWTAINALAQGATATDVFEFKVDDNDGGSATQTLTITLTGTNDLPKLAAALLDQSFSGAGNWRWQIPASSFTDAEGLDLTYSVQAVTNEGGLTPSGDGSLPAGLVFDEASRTFSGDPTTAGTYYIKVTATDSAGAVISDVFKLDLSAVGNQGPYVAAPVSAQVVQATNETTEVTFDAALGGQEIIFDGQTIALGSGVDAATVAAAVVTAGATENYTVALKDGSTDTVVFTATASGNKVDVTDVVGAGTFNGTVNINKVKDGGTAQPESFILTFNNGAGNNAAGAADQTFVFDGITVTLTNPSDPEGLDPEDVVDATEIATQVGATTFANWTAAKVDGADAVRFTSKSGNTDISNVTADNFTGTLTTADTWNIQLAVTNGSDGLEVFEVKYSGGYSGSTLTFDGKTATAGDPVTADAVASAIAAKTGDFPNYSAVIKTGATDTVIFTADASGSHADITSGSFTGTYTGTPAITTTVPGSDWSFQLPVGTFADPEGNTLTYSAALNGSPLVDSPALTFDEASATFAGNGTALPAGTLTVIASDAVSGLTATTTVNLSIGNASDGGVSVGTGITGPTWDGAGVKTFQVPANAFTYSEGDTNGNALTYTATLSDDNPLPGWLSLDASTGVLSGNPVRDAAGTLNIKVSATDSNGTSSTASQTFTLTVTNPNDAPTVAATVPDYTLTAGSSLGLDIGDDLFTDPDGGVNGTAATTDATSGIVYSAQVSDGAGGWTDLPDWLTFNPTTHLFSGNPPAGTPYLDIKVIGTDAGGATAETTFKLNLATAGAAAAAPNNTGTLGSITDDNGGAVAKGDVLSAPDPVDGDGYTPANVVYQWQMRDKTGEGTYGDWVDIAGADAKTFTLTQNESSSQVRVQAFYTDKGGFAEAPVSGALTVPALNVAGTADITGSPTPGQTLVVTLGDDNGLTKATPTYTWYRASDAIGTGKTVIGGASGSSYTLTNDDGSKYVSVTVSYTDDEGTVESVSDVSGQIQLGIAPPQAGNDTGTADEAGGVDNASGGSNATGNLFLNDIDPNSPDTKALTALRSGNAEGLGTVGLLEGTDYVVAGEHGTLRVNKTTGDYTYTVNQWGWSVESTDTQPGFSQHRQQQHRLHGQRHRRHRHGHPDQDSRCNCLERFHHWLEIRQHQSGAHRWPAQHHLDQGHG